MLSTLDLDLPRVRLISLQHCPSVGDACLAHVGRMRGLDTVLLNDSTRFGREGLAAIAALPRLTCLDLRGCTQIDGSCVEALAAASHLERLGVTATSMSPDDVARLRAALPGCHVDDDPAGIHVVMIDGARVRGWVELPGRNGR